VVPDRGCGHGHRYIADIRIADVIVVGCDVKKRIDRASGNSNGAATTGYERNLHGYDQ
jgi:hypothetical protein